MKILVINAGSSSLKYQLFDMDTETVLAKGLCERIGIDGHLKHTPLVGGKPVFNEDYSFPTHAEAISAVIDKLTSAEYGVVENMDEIQAVGHRVLHGGAKFACSVLIDDNVMDAIRECIPLGPLHNPANITGIEACQKVMQGIPQVAVFDTAFHQTMPPKAYMYAIPYEYYENDSIRRYGFHGTSHRYIAGRTAELLGKPEEELKIISCHMGNGSSICAIDGGKCVDTSMGLGPLAGLPMGTRAGDIDSTVLQFIMNKYDIGIDDMLTMLNKKSGVLGISGLSSDFRDLIDNRETNERAELALQMFFYSVAKYIGSYMVAMKGVDAIVFTGGIGENSVPTRKAISEYLTYLGVKLDEEINAAAFGKEAIISTEDSPIKLMVVPTNEELVIARDTLAIAFAK
ncbi:MAG: acetate/propionate family kinase [Oscillospiraceae bacterium]|jgi:acetate kinase